MSDVTSLIPTVCPSCGELLVLSETGVDLFCPNTMNCPDQIKFRLSYYTSRQNANIIGLSDKIIEKLMINLNVHEFYDLYRLPYDEIENWEGFGEKSIVNLKESIENSRKTMSPEKFLSALGIDGIGKEVAKLFVKHLPK